MGETGWSSVLVVRLCPELDNGSSAPEWAVFKSSDRALSEASIRNAEWYNLSAG